MVHLMNVLVEELCVQQSVNVIKTNFLKPIVCTNLKNELKKAGNFFRVIRQFIFHHMFHQKKCELGEKNSNDELIHQQVQNDLQNNFLIKLVMFERNE